MWANTMYELADPYNATINVCVQLCHQFGKRRAGELFYTNLSAQYCFEFAYYIASDWISDGAYTCYAAAVVDEANEFDDQDEEGTIEQEQALQVTFLRPT